MFQRFTSIIGSVGGSDPEAPQLSEAKAPLDQDEALTPTLPLTPPSSFEPNIAVSTTKGVLISLNKRIFEFGGPGEELDPVLKLGVNVEGVVENLSSLSTSIGRLLNQSGYSGTIIFIFYDM